MGKVDDALDQIALVDNLVERALLLGALSSSLLKLKQVTPVLVGRTAYECYTDSVEGNPGLFLAVAGGKPAPRVLQEVFGAQLKGIGSISEWLILDIRVRLEGGFATELPELCRDFQTDFGVAKLMPAEELTAERVLASFYPVENDEARFEAKMLLAQAMNESFVMDWQALQRLCDSQNYRTGEQLGILRAETRQELDSQIEEGQPSPANGDGEVGAGQTNEG
jgi:hypothetical protein